MNESDPTGVTALDSQARTALAAQPSGPESLRMRARDAALHEPARAERLLGEAITLAPGFIAAHADLAALLCGLGRSDEALTQLDHAAASYPDEIWPLSLKAAVLSTERRAEEALAAHEAVMARAPHAAVPRLNYAHALKTLGRTQEAVACYRKALELDPANGSAWWGLADLRTVPLLPADVAAMQGALRGNPRDLTQQAHLHYALGKGLGDLGNYELSFQHYQEANRLRGQLAPHDPEATRELVDRFVTLLTPDRLGRHATSACDANDAIFIIGMPRTGSTLVEQILASHPLVEGTGELFELQAIADRFAPGGLAEASLPAALDRLSDADLREIGETYLGSTRKYRASGRPFFTDKMPFNWRLAPLIHLALPNAKIIDVRRNPLACCFSSFTTYFNRETGFPSDLMDLGRYYRDYARLIEHMNASLPGRIFRLDYERLVEDLEGEVARLLAYLGLPPHPGCLRFHETQRAVYTPSSQQVRSPINRKGLDHWRNYEPWLRELKDSIGGI
jgi:tetratricopeptide (TPR) repeat protein